MKLSIEHEGSLYKNPKPGFRAECAFLPNVVPLGGDEIICVYRVGQAFYSNDGKLALLRSTDGARTWQQCGVLWDPASDNVVYNYSVPHAARLADGTLLLVASRIDQSGDLQEPHNEETGGFRYMEKVLFRSEDGGRTWEGPRVIDLGDDGIADVPSQIIELTDGRLWIPCEVWKSWDDTSELHIKGYCLFSQDGGRTWNGRVDFPSTRSREKMFSHTRYTKMLDGRILGLQWTQSVGGQQNFELHRVLSDRSGTDWPEPIPVGIQAQTCWPADLGEGRLALAYTSREGRNPGVYVVLSADEGLTWDLENQVQVWDAVGQEFLGVDNVPDYPASHDNIAFGKPNLARLSNGSLVAAWWCTQACVTHARYAKLRVE